MKAHDTSRLEKGVRNHESQAAPNIGLIVRSICILKVDFGYVIWNANFNLQPLSASIAPGIYDKRLMILFQTEHDFVNRAVNREVKDPEPA